MSHILLKRTLAQQLPPPLLLEITERILGIPGITFSFTRKICDLKGDVTAATVGGGVHMYHRVMSLR